MADYVQHLVDQDFPTCPHCQRRNTEETCPTLDDEIRQFDCLGCGTRYFAKAEIHTVWSTLDPENDDG